MELKSYAKINLSLDVLGRREDGYHNISSLMQDVGLHDVLVFEKCSKNETKYKSVHCTISNVDVYLCSCDKTIPMNEDNLVIKGAKAVLAKMQEDGYRHEMTTLYVAIEKMLPVAAGIAGGSGNAAVTMLAINALAGYHYSLRELMSIGAKVGADVPYSLMMNAKKNAAVLEGLNGIEEAGVAAEMTGIGDVVKPVEPIHRHVIMINPGIKVSTGDAYKAIDERESDVSGLFTNQFESFVLANYEEARALKEAMDEHLRADVVLMSGSGPTMVAYYENGSLAEQDFEMMKTADWLGRSWRMWLTETGSPE